MRRLLNIDFDTVTYDGKFTLEKVSCFGACDVAPAVKINGTVYGHLDSEEKLEIYYKNSSKKRRYFHE